MCGALGRVLEIIVDLMDVPVGVVGEPFVNIVAVDLLDVLVDVPCAAVHDQTHMLLPGELQAHLLIEPIGGAFLQRSATGALGAVEIDLLAVAESLVGVEVQSDAVTVGWRRLAARAASQPRAAPVADANVIEDIGVVVDEGAVEQLVREVRTRAERGDHVVREPDAVAGEPAVDRSLAHAHQAGPVGNLRGRGQPTGEACERLAVKRLDVEGPHRARRCAGNGRGEHTVAGHRIIVGAVIDHVRIGERAALGPVAENGHHHVVVVGDARRHEDRFAAGGQDGTVSDMGDVRSAVGYIGGVSQARCAQIEWDVQFEGVGRAGGLDGRLRSRGSHQQIPGAAQPARPEAERHRAATDAGDGLVQAIGAWIAVSGRDQVQRAGAGVAIGRCDEGAHMVAEPAPGGGTALEAAVGQAVGPVDDAFDVVQQDLAAIQEHQVEHVGAVMAVLRVVAGDREGVLGPLGLGALVAGGPGIGFVIVAARAA